jgi:hypothetical protein
MRSGLPERSDIEALEPPGIWPTFGLTVHQTIAIWMRRISRQCDSQEEQVSAPDSTVARLRGDPLDVR